jgi:hypothetical protein
VPRIGAVGRNCRAFAGPHVLIPLGDDPRYTQVDPVTMAWWMGVPEIVCDRSGLAREEFECNDEVTYLGRCHG